MGKDKSQKVSNVEDECLHFKQVTLLCNCPPNISFIYIIKFVYFKE